MRRQRRTDREKRPTTTRKQHADRPFLSHEQIEAGDADIQIGIRELKPTPSDG
jgi:hypothetical protein